MAYRIVYSKRAVRDVEKLDNLTKDKIGKVVKRFSQKPLFYARKMVSASVGEYRWRIGNYRIIFDISGNTIQVLRIGHRREIYRR